MIFQIFICVNHRECSTNQPLGCSISRDVEETAVVIVVTVTGHHVAFGRLPQSSPLLPGSGGQAQQWQSGGLQVSLPTILNKSVKIWFSLNGSLCRFSL